MFHLKILNLNLEGFYLLGQSSTRPAVEKVKSLPINRCSSFFKIKACNGLAKLIERGVLKGKEMETLLRGYIDPVLESRADTLVLACTHYLFAMESIRKIAGSKINIIDPSPAIARHLEDMLSQRNQLYPQPQKGTHSTDVHPLDT